MGRSLHNKIALGRRTVLFNLPRLRTAAGIASIGAVLAVWMLAGFK